MLNFKYYTLEEKNIFHMQKKAICFLQTSQKITTEIIIIVTIIMHSTLQFIILIK